MARPSKFDADAKQRLLSLLVAGESMAQAAVAVGCSRQSVHRAARNDQDFAWRLRLAQRAGEEYRRNYYADTEVDPVAGMFCMLHQRLLAISGNETPSADGATS